MHGSVIADAFVAELRDELEWMKEGASYRSDWDVGMYLQPSLPPAYDVDHGMVSEQELSDFRDIMKSSLSNRMERVFNGQPLDSLRDEIVQSNMVILDHGKSCEHGYPFWMGRVLENFPHKTLPKHKELKIQWMCPKLRFNAQRGNITPLEYLSMRFTEDVLEMVANKNQRSTHKTPKYFQGKNNIVPFPFLDTINSYFF